MEINPEDLLGDPAAAPIEAIVIGPWSSMFDESDSRPVVEALVSSSGRLPALRGIFLGDITMEECEISWINQSDVSPLFGAYPHLEHFTVRGGNGLALGRLHHDHLRSLVIQTGGMDRSIVRAVAAADLPQLEHLELWLGDEGYGANYSLDDLAPILSGDRFPRLRYLGLRNSEIADAIAAAVAQSPILSRIQTLDLSLGTLGDEGAAALLASPAVRHLHTLDLHHHYLSTETMDALQNLGIEVDLSEQEEPDEDDGETYRYVAVGE